MSFGNLAPYRRRIFGRDERFATGSLLFDLRRQMLRFHKEAEPHKTRLFPDL